MDRFDAAIGFPDDDRRECGGATVEFVIVLPVFILIFLTSFEASMLLTRQVMLERGIDLAVRDIRLNSASTIGADTMRNKICQEAHILPDCLDNLMVELRVVDPLTWNAPTVQPPCADLTRTILPPTQFETDRANKIVVVRACFAVNPILPAAPLGSRLVDDFDGAYRMVASSVFVVEPPKNSATP
ncbi:MAG: TadE family protein [Pseudomonadota bacterium]